MIAIIQGDSMLHSWISDLPHPTDHRPPRNRLPFLPLNPSVKPQSKPAETVGCNTVTPGGETLLGLLLTVNYSITRLPNLLRLLRLPRRAVGRAVDYQIHGRAWWHSSQ